MRNVDAQRAFYLALGWPLVLDSEDFVVFELRGALLALFPVEKLGADAHAEPEIGQVGIRFNIIITVDAPDEVDALAETVRRAGGRFTKPPTDAEFFVGRDAYFADPEGNYWEIACAPEQPGRGCLPPSGRSRAMNALTVDRWRPRRSVPLQLSIGGATRVPIIDGEWHQLLVRRRCHLRTA